MTLSRFTLRNRNPDVLECIANLSSDEVFTPPSLANQMLDSVAEAWSADNEGADIWADPNLTFLDPCTKSGVFLREIAKRLIQGLEPQMPDLQERVEHILTKQVFGIGITKLTSLLARRSLYCSKHANGDHSVVKSFDDDDGNIWFESTEHTWKGKRCTYCGASEGTYSRDGEQESHAYKFIHTDNVNNIGSEVYGKQMQFDVVIGNPPYQLGDSGGDSVGGFAMPIYQKFVQSAKSLNPRFICMITPSRWFAGGRGLNDFRKEMLQDKRIRYLVDYLDAKEAFPGTQIKGGVSYFLWDNVWNGECAVSTVHKEVTSKPMSRLLGEYDVLIRRNEAISILSKVIQAKDADEIGDLSDKVSPIQPFSIRTNFKGGSTSSKGMKEPIRLLRNGDDRFIERSDVPRNDSWIDEWKVLLGAAYGAGERIPHQIFNIPIIAEPGSACTETYLVIDRFDSKNKAEMFSAYLRTRFVRFLVSLRKHTQHLYNERFRFVPDIPIDRYWTDEMLYEKYGLTEEEQAFIESQITEMSVESGVDE